jgi:hypothetical protein
MYIGRYGKVVYFTVHETPSGNSTVLGTVKSKNFKLHFLLTRLKEHGGIQVQIFQKRKTGNE